MKNIKILLIVLTVFSLFSCKSKIFKHEPVGKVVDMEQFVNSKQSLPLAQVYYEHGDFINTRDFPPIIKNTDVYKNGDEYIIVDLRRKDDYEAGHINSAYNLDKKDVIDFLKTKRKANSAKKVVFVCYTGQKAAYVTGITRYAGFDNTYVMLFGMAGWNSEFSTPLKKAFGNLNDKSLLEIAKGEHKTDGEHHAEVEHEKEVKVDYTKFPKVGTGKFTEVVEKRAKQLLSLKRPEFLLKKDELFGALKKDKNAYYPLAYMNKKQFDFAHIDNAHQFTTRKDLSPAAKLGELPTGKPIVVYCKTGHTASNATAYLKMIGYDAHSLILGSSAFMHKMWSEQGWQVKDVSALISELPVVRGSKRTNSNPFLAKAGKKKTKGPAKPMVRRKKKEVSGGCG